MDQRRDATGARPLTVRRPVEPGRVAVLGVGQLGGSLALAGRAAGLFRHLVGFGRSEASLRRARDRGLVDEVALSAAEAVAGAETVILAVPLAATAATVEACAPGLSPGALVIDVGSTKANVVAEVDARVPSDVDFVGCHPLAGTERFGPDAANPALFKGRVCLVCPSGRTSTGALGRARALWAAVGAEVIEMDAAAHDRLMAAVSHLPHVAAYSLAAVLADLSTDVGALGARLQLTSLRDTTRIAASGAEMWRDIFFANRDALLPLMDQLRDRVGQLRDAIAREDAGAVTDLLETGRAARNRFFPT